MLQRIHEHTKGWIAALVLIAISASFVLWGVQYYVSGAGQGGGVIAKVEGKSISKQELNAIYQEMQQRFSATNQVLTPEVEQQLKMMALQNIIMQTILVQFVTKENFDISKAQADLIITSMPQFQQNGQFSPALFQQVLYQNNLSSPQFYQRLKEQFLLNQAMVGIQNTDFVLPNELKTASDLMNQTRDFSYIIIPAKTFAASANPSDKLIQHFYKQHQNKFKTPETVSIEYILLSPTEIGSHVVIPDAAINQYYQDHLDNYRIPEQWTVEHIFIPVSVKAAKEQSQNAKLLMDKLVARIKNKEAFSTLMKEQNGFTQTVTARDISPRFLQIVKSLKPSEVSLPFQTAEGWHLLHLLSAQPEKMQAFDQVKDNIKKEMIQQKIQNTMSQMNEQLSNLSYTNPDNLTIAANSLKVKTIVSPLFTRQGSKTGITADPKVVQAAFNDSVLNQGNNSDPIILKDNSVVVLRVKSHHPASIQPLAEVQPQIKQTLINQLSHAHAAVLANQLESNLQSGKNIENLLSEHQLSWVDKKSVSAVDKTVDPEVLKAVYQMKLKKNDAFQTVSLKEGGVALIKLTKVQLGDFSKDATAMQKNKALAEQLTKQMGQISFRLYVESIRKQAKVKIYQAEIKNLMN